MIKEDILALDLGTTKFCIAALQPKPALKKLEFSHVVADAKGMRRGMVANMAAAHEGLLALVEKAEQRFERDITKVVVGIAGSHLRGHKITVSLNLEEREVKAQHLTQLYEQAQHTLRHPERELLHCIPTSYCIDDRAATDNPIGLSGRHLQGHFFFIDSDRLYLKDIVKLCNQSGLEVRSFYAEPFASASVSVDEIAKDIGVAIADIGGGTTDGIVFRDGKPEKLFTVNIGGQLLTQDLAVGLGVAPATAEWLKQQSGLYLANEFRLQDAPFGAADVDYVRMQGILGARVVELAKMMANELLPYKGQLGAGLILTGGGSAVKGLETVFSKAFSVPVKRVEPQLPLQGNIPSDDGDQMGPDGQRNRLATVYGLLNLEYGKLVSEQQQRRRHSGYRYLSHFVNWIRELS